MKNLKITPLGGLGEIGMNCLALETQDEIIVIDCGVLFSDLDDFGIDFVIPRFDYLLERKEKISGIVITHGHEDHIGALPYLMKAGLRVPIYASQFPALLVRSRLQEQGFASSADVREFRIGEKLEFKDFKIKTVNVNHSIIEAAALIIDTPIGRLIHTGDFKFDQSPFYGQPIDLDQFKQAGDEGVLLLMSDSTNVEREGDSTGEESVYRKLEKILANVEGMTVVSLFASNIARIGQIFELARKSGKKVAVTGRSLEQNVGHAESIQYLKDAASVLIPIEDVEDYPKEKLIVIASGSQGEFRSALTRISLGEHKFIDLEQKDLVVLSSKFIPGNELAIARVINNLFKQGAEVLYEAVQDVHVSGHANRSELKKMLELTRPRFFMPLHGEYRHLVHHAGLAKETGVHEKNVVIAVSGDTLELTPESLNVVAQREDTRVYIEAMSDEQILREVFRRRRKLAGTGVVSAIIAIDPDSGRILKGPRVVSDGVVAEEKAEWLFTESAKVIRKVVHESTVSSAKKGGVSREDLEEEIRLELRRYYSRVLGKKPVVVSTVL